MKLAGFEFEPRDLLQHAIFGGSFGGGMYLVYELIEREPRLLIDTFRAWGPLSLICLVGMVMMDRGFKGMIAASRESAAAQQKLADAVNMVASKDDIRAREMELVVDHLARNSRQILADLQLIKHKLAGDQQEGAHERSQAAGV